MLHVMPSTIVLFLSRNRSKRICVTIRPPDKTDKALWGLCFYCGKKKRNEKRLLDVFYCIIKPKILVFFYFEKV